MGASPQGFESLRFRQIAAVAQVVEHILGKDEVTSSSLVSSSKTVFQKKRCFFIFLLPVGDKNIKARFFAKSRAELLAPALLQIKILCAFLCIRLSSSAALTQSIVKKMFWVVAFLYSSIQRMQEYKSTVFAKTVRSCRRHRTTIENTSCSHRLCLSSSAVKRIDLIE